MKFITASAAMLILATTAGLAQTVAPSTPRAFSHRTSGMAMTDAEGKAAAARSESLMQQRVDEMKATVAKMHVLLKQMQTTAVATHSKDPVAKANLQMWELMVGQFDKQLAELGQAARVREDMESRRQAMYKQAEQRAGRTDRYGGSVVAELSHTSYTRINFPDIAIKFFRFTPVAETGRGSATAAV